MKKYEDKIENKIEEGLNALIRKTDVIISSNFTEEVMSKIKVDQPGIINPYWRYILNTVAILTLIVMNVYIYDLIREFSNGSEEEWNVNDKSEIYFDKVDFYYIDEYGMADNYDK